MLFALGQLRVNLKQAQTGRPHSQLSLIALRLPGSHYFFAPHLGAHLAPHFGAHLLALHLVIGAHLLAPHFAEHLRVPHFVAVAAWHFAVLFVFCAATGKARVAVVRAAREASLRVVFIFVPSGVNR